MTILNHLVEKKIKILLPLKGYTNPLFIWPKKYTVMMIHHGNIFYIIEGISTWHIAQFIVSHFLNSFI